MSHLIPPEPSICLAASVSVFLGSWKSAGVLCVPCPETPPALEHLGHWWHCSVWHCAWPWFMGGETAGVFSSASLLGIGTGLMVKFQCPEFTLYYQQCRTAPNHPSAHDLLLPPCQSLQKWCYAVQELTAAFPPLLETRFFYELWKKTPKEEERCLQRCICMCIHWSNLPVDVMTRTLVSMSCPQYRKWLSIDWGCTSCALILLYSSQDVYLLLLPVSCSQPPFLPQLRSRYSASVKLSSRSWPGLSRFGLARPPPVRMTAELEVSVMLESRWFAMFFTDQAERTYITWMQQFLEKFMINFSFNFWF